MTLSAVNSAAQCSAARRLRVWLDWVMIFITRGQCKNYVIDRIFNAERTNLFTPYAKLFIQAWHQHDQITGHGSIVELRADYLVPRQLAGSGGAGQHEQKGGICHT